MALSVKLQLGNNSNGNYTSTYPLNNFKCRVARHHNEWRPDAIPQCDCLEMSLPAGKMDRTLYDWFSGRSPLSGRVQIEMPLLSGVGVEYKYVLFENGRCFAIGETFDIDQNVRRAIHLSIAVDSLKVDSVDF